MRRRTLLAAVAATGASAVAGCLDTGPADGDAPGAGGGTTTDGTTTESTTDGSGVTTTDPEQVNDGTTTGTTDATTAEGTTAGDGTATETTQGTTTDGTTSEDGDAGSGGSPADSSFTVRSAQCGQSRSSADVSFPDERTVEVRGVAIGSNGCYRARLADASVDDGTLVVRVETYLPEDSGVCSQCLTDIEYTATFSFEDGRPGTVEVHHDEERVTTAEQGD